MASTYPVPAVVQIPVNVRAFGAVGDGVHDDTAAIQAAINTASQGGRIVFFPPGDYLVSSTLNVTADGLALLGTGNKSINGPTHIIPATLGFDVLSVSVFYGFHMEGITIKAYSTTGTGGRAIVLNDVQRVLIRDVSLQYVFNGIYVTGGDVHLEYMNIVPADIPVTERYGVYVTGVSGNANFTVCRDVSVSQIGQTNARTADGFVLADGYNTLILDNCGATECNRALWSTAAGGTAPNYLQTYNFSSDHCNIGLQLDSGGDTLHVGPLVTSSYQQNVVIASTYSSGPIQILGANISNGTGDGITINGGSEVLVSASWIKNLTGNGVTINSTETTSLRVAIDGCFIGSLSLPPGVTAVYGLNVVAYPGEVTVTGTQMNNCTQFLNLGANYAGSLTITGGAWIFFGTGNYTLNAGYNPQKVSISGVRYVNPLGSLTPPASPLVSGTVYQNTYPVPITIYQPAYATTSGTAGTVAVAVGPTTTPPTLYTKQIPGTTSSTAPDICTVRVPAGWYYSFTASGATLADATVVGE